MEFTTRLELQSQATRLRYTAFTRINSGTDGIVTLSDGPFLATSPEPYDRHACYNTRRFRTMGSSRFSRPY